MVVRAGKTARIDGVCNVSKQALLLRYAVVLIACPPSGGAAVKTVVWLSHMVAAFDSSLTPTVLLPHGLGDAGNEFHFDAGPLWQPRHLNGRAGGQDANQPHILGVERVKIGHVG